MTLYINTEVGENLLTQHIPRKSGQQCPLRIKTWHHQRCGSSWAAPYTFQHGFEVRRSSSDLVSVSSLLSNWLFPRRNGGMFSLTPIGARSSMMSRPLSAIIESPGCSRFNTPLCWVNSLSDVLPRNSLDTNSQHQICTYYGYCM